WAGSARADPGGSGAAPARCPGRARGPASCPSRRRAPPPRRPRTSRRRTPDPHPPADLTFWPLRPTEPGSETSERVGTDKGSRTAPETERHVGGTRDDGFTAYVAGRRAHLFRAAYLLCG